MIENGKNNRFQLAIRNSRRENPVVIPTLLRAPEEKRVIAVHQDTLMLHAILNGKARRVSLENDSSQSWRSIFQHYEDLLTAAFWGRISYLSPESMNTFLSSLLILSAT
ncbi:hypothetical protein KKI95_10020 [Xenorhabdus bovienii]|uniref:hypothetical protein n=1 Tax=Xenorhabdus bovienii TaxID=40576 RepID=UPI0023B2976F|nr:hypothetical protein [Xenorhabdus bovienii]MDE9436255.1 hypothetical protein [Xenorhabdus bovienii]MDE9498349.1 hypothetical protein [Xenorhabdus bovienii]MDE9544556.1 hypothetical protein [Xenorhabdus bovienii]MDE9550725.1 hypothetical protein [Xenorhabdus bovienii]